MERYSILPHMETVFDREARRMPAPAEGREAVLVWQREARAKLWELLSLNRFEPCAPNPVRLSSETRDGYRVERMEMETEPNVRMPFYVLIPDGASPSDRRAAFIVPHGHGGASERTIAPDGERDVMALSLVKRGYLVFAPDARGSGDRREFMDAGDDRKKSCSHGPLNNLAIALGYSVCGMEVWDLMRLADYALSRPDADGRLGAGGFSGGGQQTLFFAACDERVAFAEVGGWFYGFKESLLLLPHNCACNFVPNLWRFFDCGDLGALIAPRPLFIESGEDDHLNGNVGRIQNVYSQVAIARNAYAALDAEKKLRHSVHEGGHEWRALDFYDFLSQSFPATI